MVQFGKELLIEQRDEWREHYVNYEELKQKLDDIIAAKAAGEGKDREDAVRQGVAAFQQVFDAQVEKVLEFYSSKSRHVAADTDGALAAARRQESLADALLSQTTPDMHELALHHDAAAALAARREAVDRQLHSLEGLAGEVASMVKFVSLNLVAIRKIVKKIAKHVAPTDPLPGFLTLEIGHPDDVSWHHVQATYLPAELAVDLVDMQHHELLLTAADHIRDAAGILQEVRKRLVAAGAASGGMGASAAAANAGRVVNSTAKFAKSTSFGGAGGAAAAAARAQQLAGRIAVTHQTSARDLLAGLNRNLSLIRHAENEAQAASTLVRPLDWWERTAGMFEAGPSVEAPPATVAGLLVNNLTCGLYMANYLAAVPFVEPLCARVGVGSDRAGTVIGMSDLSNLVATLMYTYWVQRSFKEPLLASCLLAIGGNLLFVSAYVWRSYPALLLARLVMGFGSARSVNRQYIADHVRIEHRTAASAGFVLASTLGTSAGPFLAMPLSAVPDTEWHGFAINPITCVGWLFALVWLAAGLVALLFFADPGGRAARMKLPSSSVTSSTAPSTASLRQPLLQNDHGGDRPTSSSSGKFEANGFGSTISAGTVTSLDAMEEGSGVGATGVSGVDAKQQYRVPVIALVCLSSLLLLKTVQQVLMDGIALITSTTLGWTQRAVGLYVGVVGLSMIPLNFSVMYVSTHWRVQDRYLLVTATVMSTVGLIAMGMMWLGMAPYFFGGMMLFAGTLVWEASSMSLMSKADLPDFMRRPPLSDGLLTTQAGTLGRFAGNGVISLVAELVGLGSVAQVMQFSKVAHWSLAAVCLALLGYTGASWRQLDV